MTESFYAKITPVGPEGPVDPGYGQGGGEAKPPIALPPLPGIWPPKGSVMPPIYYPPAIAMPPIYVDGTPELPINLPPGIWPPLPPEIGKPGDKVAILVAVVGLSAGDVWHGYRWVVFEKPPGEVGKPPEAGPKR